ncbi:hypothetical protein PPSIR1_23259 [Plesiocystis pacifica SIR-1]|uniref:TonB C-terminal domain-containing protein n=1 Tax=Plesiocystis pacifica SIR-1 TaxID=391625 RepID=A6GC76_9BACT|nr:TonB family protein [Plesiocystis pacifica]EDM76525.1 hypothetical protein PPSIR1_23259 [Plesiocystis pacifica SIR-1]
MVRAGKGRGRAGSIALGGALALALSMGCRASGDASEPVDGHSELCCKQAGDDNVSFSGCRATSTCRTTESVWVRGAVVCTPADSERCLGGRCCTLAAAETEPQVQAQTPEPALPSPDPAPVTPYPLDWTPLPTPIAIPTYVCPASVERGVSGTVLLHVEVDAFGSVTDVVVRQSLDPECDALAHDALLHAEFEPAMTPEGEAIASSLRWVYSFEAPP